MGPNRSECALALPYKIALVTGAGRGIGRGIALTLAKEGVDVAINDIDTKAAHAVAKEIMQLGRRAMPLLADVSVEKEVTDRISYIIGEWGGIDILVNNAGNSLPLLIEDMEKAEWDRIINVNLGGAFNCCKAVIESMRNRNGGRIVNISSVAARNVSILGGASYTASKLGLLGLTRQLAYELGPYKINVNAICVGPTITAMVERDSTPELLERVRKQMALRELLKPEDVADLVVFLASDRAKMITGAVVDIDGGWTLSAQDWEGYVHRRKENLCRLRSQSTYKEQKGERC